jgi:hypothetical protein
MLFICESACPGESATIPCTPASRRLVTKTLLPIATNRIYLNAPSTFFYSFWLRKIITCSEAFLFCSTRSKRVEVISRPLLLVLFGIALVVGLFGFSIALVYSSFQFMIYSAVNLSFAGFFGYKIYRRRSVPKSP